MTLPESAQALLAAHAAKRKAAGKPWQAEVRLLIIAMLRREPTAAEMRAVGG